MIYFIIDYVTPYLPVFFRWIQILFLGRQDLFIF